MSLYHITYTPGLDEVCLYFDGGCNLSCHGCITDHYPEDYHLREKRRGKKRSPLSISEAFSRLESLSFKKALFLGKEPTMDECFPEFVRLLKERFSSHNILLTNGCIFWERHVDEVCVSIKAITKDLFMKFTNSRCIDLILDNFKKYSKSKITLRAETVYIPNFIEVDEIERIASFIAKVDPEIPYRIDAYIPYEGDMFRRPTRKEIERAKNIAKKYLRNVSVLHEGMGLKYEVKRVY